VWREDVWATHVGLIENWLHLLVVGNAHVQQILVILVLIRMRRQYVSWVHQNKMNMLNKEAICKAHHEVWFQPLLIHHDGIAVAAKCHSWDFLNLAHHFPPSSPLPHVVIQKGRMISLRSQKHRCTHSCDIALVENWPSVHMLSIFLTHHLNMTYTRRKMTIHAYLRR
jgi:hypothetical protein